MQGWRKLLWAVVGCCAWTSVWALTEHYDAAKRDDVRAFIDTMVAKHQFDRDILNIVLSQAEKKDSVIKAITSPWEAKPWHQYRELFVTDRSIDQGVQFWKDHHDLLTRAEAEYGVPASVIVAILGVETRYGQNTGGFKVLDALSTLAFDYPPRAKFFKQELEAFLLMVREENLDIHGVKGSYAGAIGFPQFIPSSYRAYAVDFSDSGKRDLSGDIADAIGSIANYFKRHGWRAGEPVIQQVSTPSDTVDDLLAPRNNPSPKRLGKELVERGVGIDDSLKDTLVSLVSLEGASEDEYWVGFHNFYVITRYNHSNLYAMAVWQLSQAIEARYTQG